MHFFWITSRAAGVAALLASTAAVAVGLLMSTRLRKSADLRPLHEALSLATLGAIVVHALALLGDGYLKPSLADITLPFASGYQTLWTTTGIVAGWIARSASTFTWNRSSSIAACSARSSLLRTSPDRYSGAWTGTPVAGSS